MTDHRKLIEEARGFAAGSDSARATLLRDMADALEEAEKANARLDHDLGREVDRVEELHDVADRLSWAIASIEIIGEHSSGNSPWENAIEYAEAHVWAEPQGEPSDAQLLAQGFRDGVDYIDDQPGPWGAAVVAGRSEAARRVAAAGGVR